jgi:hypothetical protein
VTRGEALVSAYLISHISAYLISQHISYLLYLSISQISAMPQKRAQKREGVGEKRACAAGEQVEEREDAGGH